MTEYIDIALSDLVYTLISIMIYTTPWIHQKGHEGKLRREIYAKRN